MRFDIVTVFPRMIEAGLSEGVVHRGIESGVLQVRVHDLRDFTADRHRTVDDAPYGGGPGMVMKVEPFVRAAAAIADQNRVRDREGRTMPTLYHTRLAIAPSSVSAARCCPRAVP